jgi:dTDP-glucose pyrophosphorylase
MDTKEKELNPDMLMKDWRKALLNCDSTLQQAISSLEESALQIILVISKNGSLEGTITDGDIRRGLLNRLGMDSSISTIVQRDPLVVPPHMGRDMVIQLMRANNIHQVPVVSEDRHVVNLHVLDDLIVPPARDNLMVIMAGGRGTRLMPHTENCPKPMIQVGDKPMLEHILEKAKAEGIHSFVLAIHYLGHMIEDYFGDGSKWHVQIDYLREESPLGTAGALSLLDPVPDSPFLVTNGDVLTDIHYTELLDFHRHHDSSATMAVQFHEWQNPYGEVRTNGVDIISFEEKPIVRSYINAGVYVLDPTTLSQLKAGEHCDMPALFDRVQNQNARTIVYPMHEPWMDVGRHEDLARIRGE